MRKRAHTKGPPPVADELVVARVGHQEVQLGHAPQRGVIMRRDHSRPIGAIGMDQLDRDRQQYARAVEVQYTASGVLHPVWELVDAGCYCTACTGHLREEQGDVVQAEELGGGAA